MNELLTAIAIAMIIEGMMPFISPKSWREMVLKISKLPDSALRNGGLVVMLCGLATLWIFR